MTSGGSSRGRAAWGYTRIRGALRNLGHDVGRNTIKRVLREHGMEPARQADALGHVPQGGQQIPERRAVGAPGTIAEGALAYWHRTG